jgi:hypothetical protein
VQRLALVLADKEAGQPISTTALVTKERLDVDAGSPKRFDCFHFAVVDHLHPRVDALRFMGLDPVTH